MAYVLWPLRFVILSLIHTYVTMAIAIRTETTTIEYPGSGRKIVNDPKKRHNRKFPLKYNIGCLIMTHRASIHLFRRTIGI